MESDLIAAVERIATDRGHDVATRIEARLDNGARLETGRQNEGQR